MSRNTVTATDVMTGNWCVTEPVHWWLTDIVSLTVVSCSVTWCPDTLWNCHMYCLLTLVRWYVRSVTLNVLVTACKRCDTHVTLWDRIVPPDIWQWEYMMKSSVYKLSLTHEHQTWVIQNVKCHETWWQPLMSLTGKWCLTELVVHWWSSELVHKWQWSQEV